MPLRVIHRENGGLAAARNTGLQAAQGDWLLFLDSDDAMAPGLLEALRTGLAAHPGYDWFIGRHLEWQPDGSLTEHTGLHLVPGPFDSTDYAARLKALYGAGHWSVWKYCIRRSFLQKTGVQFLPDCCWAEDWPFDLELLLHCERLYFLDVVFTHYRVGRQGSLLTDAKNLPKRFKGLAAAQRRLAKLSASGAVDAAAYAVMEDAAADVQGLQGTEVKDDPEDHHAQHAADKAAHGALHSLVGAYQRRQLVLAAGHTGKQGRRVAAEGRHQRRQHQEVPPLQHPQAVKP